MPGRRDKKLAEHGSAVCMALRETKSTEDRFV